MEVGREGGVRELGEKTFSSLAPRQNTYNSSLPPSLPPFLPPSPLILPLRPCRQAFHIDKHAREEQEHDRDGGSEGCGCWDIGCYRADDQAEGNRTGCFQEAKTDKCEKGGEGRLKPHEPVGDAGEDEGP